MPPPSQLAIAASALNRLIKEEASYHAEFESQQKRIAKLEADQGNDENAEYTLRQEVSFKNSVVDVVSFSASPWVSFIAMLCYA